MPERGPEGISFSENLSKSFKLAESFRKSGVLGEKKDEESKIKANQEVTQIFGSTFPGQYESVRQMVEFSKDKGKSEAVNKNAETALFEVGLALSQNKEILKAATEGEETLNKLLPSNLQEVQPYILSVILTKGKDDEEGQQRVTELVDLFKLKKKADERPDFYEGDFKAASKSLFDKLYDKREDLGPESVEDGTEGRIETTMGYIKGMNEVAEKEIVAVVSQKEEPIIETVDEAAVLENLHRKDSKEYRSPYEITPESFVDAIFNQDSPRLYFTPPPEWVRKLSSKEQYLLKIEQKLANGAVYKLGTKDISYDKPRQNEVYNLPTTELNLIYEMPHVREAMETFYGELFESYEEDGRVFTKLKLNNGRFAKGGENDRVDKDGYKLNEKGERIDWVLDKLGHGVNYSFEDYKEELFLRMALKKMHPDKSEDFIRDNWGVMYKQEIEKYKTENRGKGKKTDAELEYEWRVKNALEEKKAVATAWNFLFVGNIMESADITRKLKPSQLNSDKIRTMMMPLEKFLQKMGIRENEKGEIKGTEEFFGGSIALWTRKMLDDPEEGRQFRDKLLYAADHNRDEMTDEQAKWRLFPKRVMCSFGDMRVVKTKEGEEMTFSEALLKKKEIDFKGDDLDVFVSVRDTWDEVISVTPFLIGKSEYSPVQQKEKYSLAVEKLRGLVTSINNIKLTERESRKQNGKKFGHEKFVENPEFYAWLIANSVGLETKLDIPILNRSAGKVGKNSYDIYVNGFVRTLNLDAEKAKKVKEILNGENWSSAKTAIRKAESRASKREERNKAKERRS